MKPARLPRSYAHLTWFKSSHSSDEGGNCLEVAYHWRKSSHSGSEGGDCLEVAACPHTVHVRDSKSPDAPALALAPTTWHRFLTHAAPTAAPEPRLRRGRDAAAQHRTYGQCGQDGGPNYGRPAMT